MQPRVLDYLWYNKLKSDILLTEVYLYLYKGDDGTEYEDGGAIKHAITEMAS